MSLHGPGDQNVQLARKTKLATFVLDGGLYRDADSDPLGYTWRSSTGAVVGTTSQVSLQRAAGKYVFTLTVTDGRGGSASDTVVVTVRR
ncbi:PKD domain-containing protein [Nocardioides bigeumensis]|uniref:PKD domain-containing protein n=1 Tax=Nocardioides bigeumensis TaxID=433657 RepID=A0ABP5K8V5_9ACTN